MAPTLKNKTAHCSLCPRRCDAVRDDEGGRRASAMLPLLLQRFADGLVGFSVHGGQGVVKDQNIVLSK